MLVIQPHVEHISLKPVTAAGLIRHVIMGSYYSFHLGTKDLGEFLKLWKFFCFRMIKKYIKN